MNTYHSGVLFTIISNKFRAVPLLQTDQVKPGQNFSTFSNHNNIICFESLQVSENVVKLPGQIGQNQVWKKSANHVCISSLKVLRICNKRYD